MTAKATPADIVAFFKNVKGIPLDEDGDVEVNESCTIRGNTGRILWMFTPNTAEDVTELAFCEELGGFVGVQDTSTITKVATAFVTIENDTMTVQFSRRNDGAVVESRSFAFIRPNRALAVQSAVRDYLDNFPTDAVLSEREFLMKLLLTKI
jgi:hypothetical protein